MFLFILFENDMVTFAKRCNNQNENFTFDLRKKREAKTKSLVIFKTLKVPFLVLFPCTGYTKYQFNF